MKRAGFSLVELSIVLVILGLLVGGILAGQSLIRAAELRSVGADLQRYQTAMNAFQDKYFALPGDMTNATAFWGAISGTGSTCRTTAATGTLTCDGNGNGAISSVDNNVTASELFHAWIHLKNAGLIEGSFTGVTGSGGTKNALPGTNVPASRIGKAGYTMSFWGSWMSPVGQSRNIILFGTAATAESYGAALTPTEAWNIDVKLDDGLPVSGKLGGMNSSAPWCLNGGANTYYLDGSLPACGLIWSL